MPADADDYLRQANDLLSISLRTSNPVVAAKFWEVAEDYLAKAVKLRVDHGLSALPKARTAEGRAALIVPRSSSWSRDALSTSENTP